jgi:hypothetical protein
LIVHDDISIDDFESTGITNRERTLRGSVHRINLLKHSRDIVADAQRSPQAMPRLVQVNGYGVQAARQKITRLVLISGQTRTIDGFVVAALAAADGA